MIFAVPMRHNRQLRRYATVGLRLHPQTHGCHFLQIFCSVTHIGFVKKATKRNLSFTWCHIKNAGDTSEAALCERAGDLRCVFPHGLNAQAPAWRMPPIRLSQRQTLARVVCHFLRGSAGQAGIGSLKTRPFLTALRGSAARSGTLDKDTAAAINPEIRG